jgi:hypothetical protein
MSKRILTSAPLLQCADRLAVTLGLVKLISSPQSYSISSTRHATERALIFTGLGYLPSAIPAYHDALLTGKIGLMPSFFIADDLF